MYVMIVKPLTIQNAKDNGAVKFTATFTLRIWI